MPSFHQTIPQEVFFKHSECAESLRFPVKVQSVVQGILGWWEWVCSEGPRVAPKFRGWFITPQRSEVEVKEGELVSAATQVQVTQNPSRNNCAGFLGWCRVQEIYSLLHFALGPSCICLSSNGKLLFTLKGQQRSQPPSDATETKEELRSESLVHWLMKHIWGWGWWCAKRGFQPRENTAPWPVLSDHMHLPFPGSHLGHPGLCPGSYRESQYPSHCRSPVIPCKWPAVAFCCLSAPAIGDQMAFWKISASFASRVPGSHPGSSAPGSNFPRGQGQAVGCTYWPCSACGSTWSCTCPGLEETMPLTVWCAKGMTHTRKSLEDGKPTWEGILTL